MNLMVDAVSFGGRPYHTSKWKDISMSLRTVRVRTETGTVPIHLAVKDACTHLELSRQIISGFPLL